jgi:hypothetical protein
MAQNHTLSSVEPGTTSLLSDAREFDLTQSAGRQASAVAPPVATPAGVQYLDLKSTIVENLYEKNRVRRANTAPCYGRNHEPCLGKCNSLPPRYGYIRFFLKRIGD